MTTKQAWIGFWLLALIWGSSFFFIRIGVEHVPPIQLVFIRTGTAALGLNLVLLVRGKRIPFWGRGMIDLLVLGIVNTVFPFLLITWGETRIDSGIASVLQGTAVLFTLIIAHFLFDDERITWTKSIGLLIGFAGVIVLASRSMVDSPIRTDLLGQLAIVGAAFCYAIGSSYSRVAMKSRLEPMVVSAGSMTIAAITTGVLAYLAPLFGGQAPINLLTLEASTFSAVLALGLVNTFGAYLIYYSVIATLGAARASMVTYVIPVIGLLLGILFLNEQVDARLLIGAALIIVGVLSAGLNLPVLLRRFRAQPAE